MRILLAAIACTLAACGGTSSTQPTTLPQGQSVAAVTQSAAAAFMSACVNTTTNPNAAPAALIANGFTEIAQRDGARRFESATATASLGTDTNTGAIGQCNVTPKGGTFSSSVAALRARMTQSSIPAIQLPGEEAWIMGNTGAVVLISRNQGAMTRTQPNVFRPNR